ncbi:MAG: DUF4351 domain-containing protein [Planctomycetes bacterium]|nr:DUF4351 domain-containing protein [Planctomycetota bacterium]
MAVDHDQRFKILLREFFREFFELFFPKYAALFDFSPIEWIDKEVFTDPPTGKRRYVDLLAKIPLRQALPTQRPGEANALLALIHVEIEHEDTVEPLRSRMYQYYEPLRRQYGIPVLPVALYLNVGLDGIGVDVYEEYFGDLRVLHFQYLYVGLPALDAREYVGLANWLGVALSALMRCPEDERVQLTTEAVRRLMRAPETDHRRFLLCDCVSAYAVLVDSQKEEVRRSVVSTEEGKEMTKMGIFDPWEQKGEERGRTEEARRLLRLLLQEKFGPLSPEVSERVNGMSREVIEQVLRAVIRANSLQELGLEKGNGAPA